MMGFASTLLFLSPGELAPGWVRLRHHQCRDVMSDRALQWINLLDAMSRRQAGRLIAHTESLLDKRDIHLDCFFPADCKRDGDNRTTGLQAGTSAI